uniref:Uncharacterized protein n=1 Tax=Angiostrongylus cantonensis TaxID=6313 RepID=A0A158PA95_ANGCA
MIGYRPFLGSHSIDNRLADKHHCERICTYTWGDGHVKLLLKHVPSAEWGVVRVRYDDDDDDDDKCDDNDDDGDDDDDSDRIGCVSIALAFMES